VAVAVEVRLGVLGEVEVGVSVGVNVSEGLGV
jgi:hypothetical protein